MAVFYHQGQDAYALVSFKALYSRFTAASDWDCIGVDPTIRMACKALFSGAYRRSWLLMRSPYDRTVSCFMDKYRKQPLRIGADGFQWQHCHELLFPRLGVSADDSHPKIAQRFLDFSFDEFLDVLPSIAHLDGHFKPQAWTARLLVRRNRSLRWPAYRIVRIEDQESLQEIPDIDFTQKTNTTAHIDRDFELQERHRLVIQQLYAKDFVLGNYEF